MLTGRGRCLSGSHLAVGRPRGIVLPMFPYPLLPARAQAKRRDRRGRGIRGPLMPGALPGARSRTEKFDDRVADVITLLESRCGELIDGVEFGVEDVPPSLPAPWEHGAVPLGRYFPADLGMPHRIVIYRRPVIMRAPARDEQLDLITHVLKEQIAHLTGLRPDEI